jgi:hypothetical protein
MQWQSGSEVFPQDHADVYPPERVRLDHDLPCPEHRRDVTRALRVAPARYDPGSAGGRVGVSQEYHVNSLAAQHPRSGAGCSLAARAVQHLDGDASLDYRDRISLGRDLLARASKQKPAEHREEDHPRA